MDECVLSALLPPIQQDGTVASAYAPANIALVKYWGKRDMARNLPITGSLSISLAKLGTYTRVTASKSDSISVNGVPMGLHTEFAKKVLMFVALFRRGYAQKIHIDTRNTVPMAAGLASSASGFAALAIALNQFWALDATPMLLSALARMGSGSAARSLWHGFVEWQAGNRVDGVDSYAVPLKTKWHDLRIAILKIDFSDKKISSRDGMNHTVQTSPLYIGWEKMVMRDISSIKQAIQIGDFSLLGQIAEGNALAMHATMLAARPALCYFQPQTLAVLSRIWQLRAEGLEVYATADAGPNLKLLYHVRDDQEIRALFPQAIWVNPFVSMSSVEFI